MPRGTLFCKIRTGAVEELRLKLDTCGEDFVYRDMIELDADSSDSFFSMLWAACEEKTLVELPLDWHRDMSRDGYFEREQMFAVLTPDELTNVIEMLTAARDRSI